MPSIHPKPDTAFALSIFVGCMSSAPEAGIYHTRLDLASGRLSASCKIADGAQCSFLALDSRRNRTFAIEEITSPSGSTKGAITAYSYLDGQLSLLSRLTTPSGAFCHLSLDHSARHVLAARYDEGSVSSFAIRSNGAISETVTTVVHHGSGRNPSRQAQAHAHWIEVDPADRFALVADLGMDQVTVSAYEPASGQIAASPAFVYKGHPGDGPRHLAFSPDGRHAYLVNELASSIVALKFDANRPSLDALQRLPLLPSDYTGENTAGEVVVHPSGRFVYASNRGHDSLVWFQRHPVTGLLTLAGTIRGAIQHPRHFAIDPTGRWLLCASRDLDSVHVFAIDPQTGGLQSKAESVYVPKPSCVVFAS